MSLILVAVAGCLSQGCAESTRPDGNDHATVLNFATSINVAPSHPGTTVSRFELELRAYYEQTGGARVAIGDQRITLTSAVSQSQQVSLPVNLASCLLDSQRTPAGPGCPVRIVLVLWLVNNGVKLDYQVLGPFILFAGERKTLPEEVAVAEIVFLDVVPSAPTVFIGGTVSLAARFFTAAGDTVARPVTWRTSNPEIAKVDTTGVVTGISAGRAGIEADWGEGQASFSVYVQVNAAPNLISRPR